MTYNVGRVWFTAFVYLSSGFDPDGGGQQIYFLTNETTAVGRHLLPLFSSVASYLPVTKEEAKYLMEESDGFVRDDYDAVWNAIVAALYSVYTTSMGY